MKRSFLGASRTRAVVLPPDAEELIRSELFSLERLEQHAASRPDLTLRTIVELQDAGIEPDVWKVEGLNRREDCARVVVAAGRDGRDDVGCIVLGRGADEQKVVRWLTVAASVPGFIGFAVGRTTFWDAVADFVGKRATRSQAVFRIAQRCHEWAAIFAREDGP